MDNIPFGLDSIAKMRLKGGLAGKMCHVLIFVAIAMAIISWSVHSVWISLLSLVLLFILVFIILWRLINLAHKSPHSALMEGPELLLHQQMIIGTKGNPKIIVSPEDVVEKEPLILSPSEIKTLNQPENEPSKRISSSSATEKEEK